MQWWWLFLCLALLCWWLAGVWLNEEFFPRLARKRDDGEELNRWLQQWQLMSTQGGTLSSLGAVPQFKFFGQLAETGLRCARTYGSFPRELLWEWREGVASERSFDKRWSSIKYAAWAQFALFTLITWSFVVLTQQGLMQSLAVEIYVSMFGLQSAGVCLFSPCLGFLARRRLAGFAALLQSLYVLRSLSGAGLATGVVLQEANLGKLQATGSLKLLVDRVTQLATIYQQQGGALGKEAQILLQEARFQREEVLAQLTKTAEGMKLVFLLIFYAGPYFLFLTGLVYELLRTS
jgi:hypothetical protein